MEHYFAADAAPLDPAELTTRHVRLAGFEVDVVTAPGVFSAHRVDLGTSVLLRTVAGEAGGLPPTGTLVDLGCGWGPLAITMALTCPDAQVWGIDINPRALELTRLNAGRLNLANLQATVPNDVPEGWMQHPAGAIDVIWSNPPIRVGKEALHELLTTWLARLTATGHADLVVQKNLGSDSLQSWLTDQGYPTERLASAKGYRVLRATKA
ncbi:MAG: methyltransferase [Bifidobacteriaceae bacterium]|nr:methyltransferase [Bifidobacteriaceae bacterium]